MNAVSHFAGLHFGRPWWLAALLLLPLLILLWRKRQRRLSVWQTLIDPHLLPHVLERQGDRRSRAGLWAVALAYALAVLALAGPSWRQSSQPLWQSRTPLVVALDLSSASLAGDLPPSRLAQARAKLATLLRERRGGQIGLVVFAADAFTVAPLTDDAANVALFVDSLQPDIMPRDGQRSAEAIAWSAELLQRAGVDRGDILLITDHADDAAVRAASEAAAAGFAVSVLGLGTDDGAMYRTPEGAIAKAQLDAGSLRRLASEGNGRYRALASDDGDLQALGVLDPQQGDAAGEGGGAMAWRDEGYWLLLPLMLIAMFAFRRHGGTALVALVIFAALPVSGARAADVWRRPEQAAYAQMQEGNDAYRKGDYLAAAQAYAGLDSATAHYNRGNALAKAGRYPQAIEAYDRALRHEPGMADALANKRAVEAAMKRQQQAGGGGQSKQGQGDQSKQQPGQSSSPRQAENKKPSQSGQQQQSPPQDQQNRPQETQSPQSGQSPEEQAQADRAQRERMQRALEQRDADSRTAKQAPTPAKETPEQRERRLANEAWLRRVPDDPGGLLRAKFRLEYERRQAKGRGE